MEYDEEGDDGGGDEGAVAAVAAAALQIGHQFLTRSHWFTQTTW